MLPHDRVYGELMLWPSRTPLPPPYTPPDWVVEANRQEKEQDLRAQAIEIASAHCPNWAVDDLIREAEKIYGFLTGPRPLSDKHAIPDGE